MLKDKLEQKQVSELRKDPVSHNWVVIARERAKRPKTYKTTKAVILEQPKSACPFCNLDKDETTQVALVHPLIKTNPYFQKIKQEGDPMPKWKGEPFSIIDVFNKFPAFIPKEYKAEKEVGPYKVMSGYGYHEVIIPASHHKSYGQLEVEQIKEILDVFQARYLALAQRPHIDYISIIHNQGPEAGASISHPHSQLFAIPVISKDIKNSLNGSKKYFEYHGKCAHCEMLEWEKKQKDRIVFENNDFIIVCPFASVMAFETRIYPKLHSPYFEKIKNNEKLNLAEALKFALSKIHNALGNPPYNFFIHTAPADEKEHDHYHWHIEIMPKVTTWAGFELGTGIEISTIDPSQAAEILRNTK